MHVRGLSKESRLRKAATLRLSINTTTCPLKGLIIHKVWYVDLGPMLLMHAASESIKCCIGLDSVNRIGSFRNTLQASNIVACSFQQARASDDQAIGGHHVVRKAQGRSTETSGKEGLGRGGLPLTEVNVSSQSAILESMFVRRDSTAKLRSPDLNFSQGNRAVGQFRTFRTRVQKALKKPLGQEEAPAACGCSPLLPVVRCASCSAGDATSCEHFHLYMLTGLTVVFKTFACSANLLYRLGLEQPTKNDKKSMVGCSGTCASGGRRTGSRSA